MKIHREDTAIVFIDPQNEVLSEKGLAWPLVHESVRENNTIENMERIFKAARRMDSRFSSLLTISIPRTKVGNSTDRLKPMRQRPACSLAKAF
jgi:hypothetical protein